MENRYTLDRGVNWGLGIAQAGRPEEDMEQFTFHANWKVVA